LPVVPAHQFSLTCIEYAVNAVKAGSSLRMVEWTLQWFGKLLGFEAPCFSTVRLWMLRVGLELWLRRAPPADDWIWIADHVAQADGGKCLAIVGIRRSQLVGRDFALEHVDVTRLHTELMPSSTGEDMHRIFSELAERIGVPEQIVSDHGSDMLKGERLFQADHPTVVVTWDITHRMARLLIAAVADDEQWVTFKSHCQRTRAALLRTRWSVLSPPSTAGATRCGHFDKLVLWARQTLARYDAGAVATINSIHVWDDVSSELLRGRLPEPDLARLDAELSGKQFEDRDSFLSVVRSLLGTSELKGSGLESEIVRLSDQGQREFVEHFDWLVSYRQLLGKVYIPFVEMTYSTERLVKHEGLHGQSASDWQASQPSLTHDHTRARDFQSMVLRYLLSSGGERDREASLLGTSDVLESQFGKYKRYTERGPDKAMNSSILALPLLSEEITTELIESAMSRPVKCLGRWISETIGTTRRALQHKLGSARPDTKPA
jgi:hypothetical protein